MMMMMMMMMLMVIMIMMMMIGMRMCSVYGEFLVNSMVSVLLAMFFLLKSVLICDCKILVK